MTHITDVRAHVLEGRPARGVNFAIGQYDVFTSVLVEVHADDGTVGYGEAIGRRAPRMAKVAVEDLLAPVLRGKDPRNIEGLWWEMLDQLRRWGHTKGVVVEAISGVDIALWDLVGKLDGQPVWQLLHGVGRTSIPCYASSVYIADLDTMCREAVEQAKRGFPAVKIKIGRTAAQGGMRADVEALAAIRAAVGDDIDLLVDANGAYDAATAARFCHAVESLDIGWFEEPVPPYDLAGYARLRAHTAIPLATGETEFSVFGFQELIVRGLIDTVQPDLGRCGGITGARQVYTLSFANNLAFAPHTGLSGGLSQLAAIHASAAAPNLQMLEYMFIDNPVRDIFVGGFPNVRDGHVAVPTAPGLGIDLDHTVVEALRTGD